MTLTPAEVKTRLTNAGYSIGTVAKVEVTKRTATNNVAEVTVTDTDGKKVTLTRSSVRTVFGLKSINYSITANTAATSSQTKTAVQKTASATKTSVKISPSVHTVTVDGKVVKPQGYNINDNNYYKLRDVAWILNGTGSEFNVTWDGANNRILLSPNAPYVKVGGEMSDTVAAVKKLSPSTAAVAVGNKTVQLTGYNVNDNNYYKLRDIGDALGFAVDWDRKAWSSSARPTRRPMTAKMIRLTAITVETAAAIKITAIIIPEMTGRPQKLLRAGRSAAQAGATASV